MLSHLLPARRLRIGLGQLFLLACIALLVQSGVDDVKSQNIDTFREFGRATLATEYFNSVPPTTSMAVAASQPMLCRLGVNGTPVAYPDTLIQPLRALWFFNWRVVPTSFAYQGMEYAPSVFVKQWKWDNGLVLYGADLPYAVPYTYTLQPSLSTIKGLASQYPGQLWLVGNEIERRDWTSSDGGGSGQQEILPELYAQAYHQVYHAIKAADPTARVANGSIVVPTPLRLKYMSRVWDEYVRRYKQPMPVDVWQIHLYMGPEKRGEWGLDIPAGINDVDVGMFYYGPGDARNILVNKDFSLVPELLRNFRVWMKERGEQNKPLFITEFGVSMPDWVMSGEFTAQKIHDEYMYPGLNHLLNISDPDLGYPADDYRLVQSVWWWSLDYDFGDYEGDVFYPAFNGNLLWSGVGPPNRSPYPQGFSQLGQYWLNYVSNIASTVNLKPLAVVATRSAVTGSDAMTASIKIRLSNSGNTQLNSPFSVKVTDIASGSTIATLLVTDPIAGCGSVYETSAFLWSNLPVGVHRIRVTIDADGQIPETNEADNVLDWTILVPSTQLFLPLVRR